MKTEGFEELEKHGFISDYVEIKDGIMKPAFSMTVESCLAMGFFPKGTKVRFSNKNGYDYERETALKNFLENDVLTVRQGNIGRSSSTYSFEEVGGSYNTVMFERID